MLAAIVACLAFNLVHAATPRKVIRDVFPVAESGFDPPAANDLYSAGVVHAIFDTLYTYDYLARPAKLVPGVAAALPEVADEGRVYTIRLVPGVYFQADPVFGNAKRELTAEDVVYSFERLLANRGLEMSGYVTSIARVRAMLDLAG